MGCDIHLYREKRVGQEWITADEWRRDPPDDGEEVGYLTVEWGKRAYTGRNYDLFGALASGVRREFDFSFAPRGMPLTCSAEVLECCDRYGEGGHSHSYLYFHELMDFAEYLKANTMPISGMKDRKELAKLRESIASGTPDWNLIYPYCQWSSGCDFEEFTFDVPCSFGIGESLERIIQSFKGIEGKPHDLRIVFWFDN